MRDRRCAIRLSDEEWDAIQQQVSDTGLTLSEYFRRCALRRKITSTIDKDSIDRLFKINADLARLGNLMNRTMVTLSDEEGEDARTLIEDAYNTLNKIGETQSALKAKIAEISA